MRDASRTGPQVLILGGGPAGLGAAYRLCRDNKAAATVLEAHDVVGGNAGSFEVAGQRVDFGSHRLHPACGADILADIKGFLGEDLLDRPRHGRIKLAGSWIHFPLKPVDLALRADRSFLAGTLLDTVTRRRSAATTGETFASVLEQSLGPTICEGFYFPYARKIWGEDPSNLSAVQARRRVSAGSFGKLIRKVLSQVPGLKGPGSGRFYYPRHGYGAISEAYAEAARSSGAKLELGQRVVWIARSGERWTVSTSGEGTVREFEGELVWSTLPLTVLARLCSPSPPPEVLAAADAMRFRSMILVYVTIPVERFTPFDAHYFPGEEVDITRLSEPKNYADRGVPEGSTTLCAELPCSPEDECWGYTDSELGELVSRDLTEAGVPLPAPPIAVNSRRLSHAYPIYLRGYDQHFQVLDAWAQSMPGLLSFGRQGLFAHDNTHHALAMAYAAADCVRGSRFDAARWAQYRTDFESHVVED